MSEPPKNPAWRTVLIALILTAALSAAAYYAWIYANFGVRQLPRGSAFFAFLKDLRFFIGLLAVFAALTVLDKVVGLVRARLGKR